MCISDSSSVTPLLPLYLPSCIRLFEWSTCEMAGSMVGRRALTEKKVGRGKKVARAFVNATVALPMGRRRIKADVEHLVRVLTVSSY